MDKQILIPGESPDQAQQRMLKAFAEQFNYDQVVVIARRVNADGRQGEECVSAYGRGKVHSEVAHNIAKHLVYKVMGWKR